PSRREALLMGQFSKEFHIFDGISLPGIVAHHAILPQPVEVRGLLVIAERLLEAHPERRRRMRAKFESVALLRDWIVIPDRIVQELRSSHAAGQRIQIWPAYAGGVPDVPRGGAQLLREARGLQPAAAKWHDGRLFLAKICRRICGTLSKTGP